MTSIANPMLQYILLALSVTILIGIPLGVLLRQKRFKNRISIPASFSLIIGAAVNTVGYKILIDWCYSLETPPFGVSCMNFLPWIIGSFVIGLFFAILVTRYIYTH